MADPRAHRHARIMEGNRITYACGCVNEIQDSGVLRSVSKCRRHVAEAGASGLAYYQRLGRVDAAGKGLPSRHVEELTEALGEIPRATAGHRLALEIGGGASAYCPAILEAGYSYQGVEPDPWAAAWTRETYGVDCSPVRLEDAALLSGYTLILAAHSLEHMPDAPGAIVKCARLLEPGGELWVVVPDDSDPLNPDHMFFFNQASLRRCVESAGLTVLKLESRRRVEHEEFLYLRASKP